MMNKINWWKILSIFLFVSLAFWVFCLVLDKSYERLYFEDLLEERTEIWNTLRQMNTEIELYKTPTDASYNELLSRVITILKSEGLSQEEISLALKIAWYESNWNPQAININDNGTKDVGLWQINDVHGLTDEQRYSVDYSTRWAAKHLKENPEIWSAYSIASFEEL